MHLQPQNLMLALVMKYKRITNNTVLVMYNLTDFGFGNLTEKWVQPVNFFYQIYEFSKFCSAPLRKIIRNNWKIGVGENKKTLVAFNYQFKIHNSFLIFLEPKSSIWYLTNMYCAINTINDWINTNINTNYNTKKSLLLCCGSAFIDVDCSI